LSKLVSQPIYRDSIINAKFLSGVAIITIILVSIVLIITGLDFLLPEWFQERRSCGGLRVLPRHEHFSTSFLVGHSISSQSFPGTATSAWRRWLFGFLLFLY